MKYADITDKTDKKKELRQKLKTTHLYSSIFRDVVDILEVFLPSDTVLTVSQHLKSIMYCLIELKTGRRPDNF